jgi:hypothetical protein
MSAPERWEVAEWRRQTDWPRKPLPAPKVYSPRLRRDQIKALFYLKRFEGRPMTRLAQEAVDRFLDKHGGVEGLIERGLAAFGDPGEEARQRRGAR